jgi:hypothetical protein
MRIAILAWGSLIWNPRYLPLASEWVLGGPVLPIEFARVSADGRLTFGPRWDHFLWLAGRDSLSQILPSGDRAFMVLWPASSKVAAMVTTMRHPTGCYGNQCSHTIPQFWGSG